jgi:N-acylneuraminate cytidylyltransferase
MKKVAIILARGGSKRIPLKNIKPFLGKPIIAYSIEAALSSCIFDEVMVSTDNDQIAEISKQHGAKVPFLRTESTSNDSATTAEALIEVLNMYKESGQEFDYACCLYPTAPFISDKKLKNAFDFLLQENYASVFPVMPFSYPILRSLKIENNRLMMNYPEYKNTRSQDFQPAYHDAGQFYFFKVETLYNEQTLFTDNSGAIIIDELEGQDIDNLSDWAIAEMKYKMQFQK